MFLLILDKDAIKSAELVPKGLRFKQLLELCQMICSAGYSDIYKKIYQGKELQYWIVRNSVWTKKYALALLELCDKNVNISNDTYKNIIDIIASIPYEKHKDKDIDYAIFRYSKDYSSKYDTNTELPIDKCICEYNKYVDWKRQKGIKQYLNS